MIHGIRVAYKLFKNPKESNIGGLYIIEKSEINEL